MKSLYTPEEFDKAKSIDKLPLECHQCQQPFKLLKKIISEAIQDKPGGPKAKYCSQSCAKAAKPVRIVKCEECHEDVRKSISASKKTGLDFCSATCSASYYNRKRWGHTWEDGISPYHPDYIRKPKPRKAKKTVACKMCSEQTTNAMYCSGTCRNRDLNKHIKGNRSKAEIMLVEALKMTFPEWTIVENDRLILGGLELDVYIPEKRLAIEWNGIFHYEPIHGNGALERVVKKDAHKATRCRELGIDLIVIADMTSHPSFIKTTIETLINQLKLIRRGE